MKLVKLLGVSLVIVLFASPLFVSAMTSARFADVDEDTYYANSINWMAGQGVIIGYPGGVFEPDQCVKRAEMLKMLFLMNGVVAENVASPKFSFDDLVLGEWYVPYVLKALARGTVQGYDDGTFKPGQCVKRVEAIKMAVLEFNDGKIPEKTDLALLREDLKDQSQWYYPYTTFAFAAKLVGTQHLVTDNKYFPGNDMSRKEVAEMLYRMKAIKDRGVTEYKSGLIPDSL